MEEHEREDDGRACEGPELCGKATPLVDLLLTRVVVGTWHLHMRMMVSHQIAMVHAIIPICYVRTTRVLERQVDHRLRVRVEHEVEHVRNQSYGVNRGRSLSTPS